MGCRGEKEGGKKREEERENRAKGALGRREVRAPDVGKCEKA